MADHELAPLRRCPKCDVEKPHTVEFFPAYLTRDPTRVRGTCRPCFRDENRLRGQKWRAANPEWEKERWLRRQESASAYKKRRWAEMSVDERIEHRRKIDDWKRVNPEKAKAIETRRLERIKADPAERKRQTERQLRYRSENRDRVLAQQRQNYRENADYRRQYDRAWREENRERVNQLKRERHRKDPSKRKEVDHRRRIAKRSGEQFTAADLRNILEEQGHRCSYCSVDISEHYEADHFIPLARGGGNEPENMVLACRSCNRSKGAKMPWVWRPDLFNSHA